MKRFTEALKWRDPWFRGLSVDGKLAFFYLVDNCDAAGVWEPDFQLANFCLKRDIPWDEIRSEFGDRLELLRNGKWFLTRFISFQYGPHLNRSNTAHLGVLRRLELAGVKCGPYEAPAKGLQRGLQAPKDMDKDKDRVADKTAKLTEAQWLARLAGGFPDIDVTAEFHACRRKFPKGGRKFFQDKWLVNAEPPLVGRAPEEEPPTPEPAGFEDWYFARYEIGPLKKWPQMNPDAQRYYLKLMEPPKLTLMAEG